MTTVDNLAEKFHLGWKKIPGYDYEVDFFHDFYWLKRQFQFKYPNGCESWQCYLKHQVTKLVSNFKNQIVLRLLVGQNRW